MQDDSATLLGRVVKVEMQIMKSGVDVATANAKDPRSVQVKAESRPRLACKPDCRSLAMTSHGRINEEKKMKRWLVS